MKLALEQKRGRGMYERNSRTVRFQYFSRSSLVENCSPSEYSKGVLPIRISKNVIPSDQTSDLRVSCGRPRARSGERYYSKDERIIVIVIIAVMKRSRKDKKAHLRSTVGEVAMEC